MFFSQDELIAIKEYPRKIAEEESTHNADQDESKIDLILNRVARSWMRESEKVWIERTFVNISVS